MITRLIFCFNLFISLLLYTSCLGIDKKEIHHTIIADNNSAVALMGQFNFEEAYNLFRELALISPQNTELQTNMAIALINISPDILLSVDDNTEVTIADINGDSFSDIFIPGNASEKLTNLVLLGQKDITKFTLDESHPLAQIEHIVTALWDDINDDGLLDVYLCRKGKNQLWQKDDNGAWLNIPDESNTSGKKLNTIGGALFDADHDGDLDIFAINDNGANELFNNNSIMGQNSQPIAVGLGGADTIDFIQIDWPDGVFQTKSSAQLDNIGFPKRENFDQRRPYYDFATRDINWNSRVLEGSYTKLGDVLTLVKHKDSALAIIGPGEGVHLQFDTPAQDIPEGWSRNYVLKSFGWCKDMDLFLPIQVTPLHPCQGIQIKTWKNCTASIIPAT